MAENCAYNQNRTSEPDVTHTIGCFAFIYNRFVCRRCLNYFFLVLVFFSWIKPGGKERHLWCSFTSLQKFTLDSINELLQSHCMQMVFNISSVLHFSCIKARHLWSSFISLQNFALDSINELLVAQTYMRICSLWYTDSLLTVFSQWFNTNKSWCWTQASENSCEPSKAHTHTHD